LGIRPSELGELAKVEVNPALTHFIILNQVVTGSSTETKIELSRGPGTNEIVLSGTISPTATDWREDLALDDPALFAAEALIDLLRDRGIVVRGVARSDYRGLNEPESALPGTVLAVHDSAPLWQALQVVNKVSQNLHAEMLLREVAHVTRYDGALDAGTSERQAFLLEVGIDPESTGFVLRDGSGLARQDLTTPDSTVALLLYMWQRPDHDVWLSTLPIGGVDGTLQHRFQKIAGAQRIHAKTGSIAHVNALSGYLETDHHRWIAFSVMVNGTSGHDADVHDFIDQLCALFLNE
jgi:D-alanyl-D-alanine carboxypeptidase/D-alanyl-D-alanine-endopeptidase (penicillin-binding protein 4)